MKSCKYCTRQATVKNQCAICACDKEVTSAFAMGYQDARTGAQATTAREVEARYPLWPELAVRLYLNGVDDGTRKDTFRLLGKGE